MNLKFSRLILGFQLVIFVTILSDERCYSQTNDGGGNSSNISIDQLKNVVPPSPNSMAMARYGDWPVGLYTGVPNINIPITTLKGRSIGIPVSLNYHASGNKVGDVASQVGLGWSLSGADMVISRSVRGSNDEGDLFSRYASYTDPNDLSTGIGDQNIEGSYAASARGDIDTQMDVYSFSAMGKSYRLLLQSDGSVLTVPYSNIKFLANPINSGNGAVPSGNNWIVLMEDGTKITFGGPGFMEGTVGGHMDFVSTWHVQSIITTKGETITFTYYPAVSVLQDAYFSETDSYRPSQMPCASALDLGTSGVVSIDCVKTLNLKTIESDLERLEFKMQGNRPDLIGGMKLGEIKLYSKIFSQYTEEYWFNYTYSQAVSSQVINVQGFPNTPDLSQRLRLQSMVRKDTTGEAAPLTWSFDYNPQNLPSRRSFSQDYWGYYNGANNNTLLPPEIGFTAAPHNPGAERHGNATFMQAEILTGIHYPTGGYSLFTYQGNSTDGGTLTGGLRLATIVDYDGIGGTFNSKSYQYGGAEVLAPVDLIADYITTHTNIQTTNGAQTCSTTTTTRNSSSVCVQATVQGGTTAYTQVKTVYGASGENGSTMSYFSYADDIGIVNLFPYGGQGSEEVRRGLLLKQIDYNAQGVALKELDNSYSFQTIKSFNGFKAGYYSTTDNCTNTYGYCGIEYLFYPTLCEQVFHNSSTQTIYDDAGQNPMVSTTNYYYDNTSNTQPDHTVTFNSKGDTITQWLRSAYEMPQTGEIPTMITQNMVSQIIQNEKRNNSNLISLQTTNYSDNNGTWSSILPQTVQVQNGTAASYTALTMNNYDVKGNVTSLTPVEGITKSYLWDYNLSKPSAEIVNTSPGASDFAYTSFEAGTGNWNASISSPSAPGFTGASSYNLVNSQLLSFDNLIPANSYLVSLWALPGASITINYTTVVSSDSRNGWLFYSKVITGSGEVFIMGTATVDELRICPVSSRMTTYTYGPFGVTSSTDPNNVTTYYEYDGMGRLITKRDDNNKVLQTYQYHYRTN